MRACLRFILSLMLCSLAAAQTVVEVRTHDELVRAVARQEKLDVRVMAAIELGVVTIPAGPDLIIRQTVPTCGLSWRKASANAATPEAWKKGFVNGINITGQRNVAFINVRFADCQLGGSMIKGGPAGIVPMIRCRVEHVGDMRLPYRPGAASPPPIADCWATNVLGGTGDWRITGGSWYSCGLASRSGTPVYVEPSLSIDGLTVERCGRLVYMPNGKSLTLRNSTLIAGWLTNETVLYPTPAAWINVGAGCSGQITGNEFRGDVATLYQIPRTQWVIDANTYSGRWSAPATLIQYGADWLTEAKWRALPDGFDRLSTWPATQPGG